MKHLKTILITTSIISTCIPEATATLSGTTNGMTITKNEIVQASDVWTDTGEVYFHSDSSIYKREMKIYGTANLNKLNLSFSAIPGYIYIYDGGSLSANSIAMYSSSTLNMDARKIYVKDGGALTLNVTNPAKAVITCAKKTYTTGNLLFDDYSCLKINLALDESVIPTETDTFLVKLITQTSSMYMNLVKSGDPTTGGYSGKVIKMDESGMSEWNENFLQNVTGLDGWGKEFVYSDDDDGTIFLKMSKIPEPSAFGLLAGMLSLALCVSRRRREKK